MACVAAPGTRWRRGSFARMSRLEAGQAVLADTSTHGAGTDLCQPKDGRENSKHSCPIVNYCSCTYTRTQTGVSLLPHSHNIWFLTPSILLWLRALCVWQSYCWLIFVLPLLGRSGTQLILGGVLIPTRSVPTGGIISFPTGGQNVCNEEGRAKRQVLELKSGEETRK